MLKGNFLVSVLKFLFTFFKIPKIILTQVVSAPFFQKHFFFFALIMPWTLFRMPKFCRYSLLKIMLRTDHYQRKILPLCPLRAFPFLPSSDAVILVMESRYQFFYYYTHSNKAISTWTFWSNCCSSLPIILYDGDGSAS